MHDIRLNDCTHLFGHDGLDGDGVTGQREKLDFKAPSAVVYVNDRADIARSEAALWQIRCQDDSIELFESASHVHHHWLSIAATDGP